MINVLEETLIGLDEGRKLPGNPAYNTLKTYCVDGVVSEVNGRLVKLERIQVGKRWRTSVEAYRRFTEELNREA